MTAASPPPGTPPAPAPEAATPAERAHARHGGVAADVEVPVVKTGRPRVTVAEAPEAATPPLVTPDDVTAAQAHDYDNRVKNHGWTRVGAPQVARLLAPMAAQRVELRDEYETMRARFAEMHPPCPRGCGCAVGTDDADARECACDGACCETFASVAAERDELRAQVERVRVAMTSHSRATDDECELLDDLYEILGDADETADILADPETMAAIAEGLEAR